MVNLQSLIDPEERENHKPNDSRFSAVKHGLTAKTAVLPGEDPELFQAKIDSYKASLETRNPVEDDLAEKAALASWQMDRVVKAQAARGNCELLTKPAAEKLREDLEAAGLGNRLLHDRRGPIEHYPSGDFADNEPRTSWEDYLDDPDHPEILVRRLSATVSGCQWLASQWRQLRHILELGLGIQSHEKLRFVRLMGHQPIMAVSIPEVARVFHACHVLEPQFPHAFQELRCEMHEEQFTIHKARLDQWEKVGIAPANRTAARAVLLGIIDEAVEQLKVVEAGLSEIADQAARQQQGLLGHEDGKAGEQLRRHLGSCNRLILGNLDAIHKLRRNEADGWGLTRREREGRRSGGRAEERQRTERRADGRMMSTPVDDRLVVDERGTVRPAHSYDGDLEEGLARFEREFGGSGLNRSADSWNEIEEMKLRAVPDFARWVPPVEVATGLVDPSAAPANHGTATALVDPGFSTRDGGIATALVDPGSSTRDGVIAMALVDQGFSTPASPVVARRGDEVLRFTCQGDGRGAEIGLGGSVTQVLTGQGGQSNVQNEKLE